MSVEVCLTAELNAQVNTRVECKCIQCLNMKLHYSAVVVVFLKQPKQVFVLSDVFLYRKITWTMA